MDYLDPKRQARHRLILFTGYICTAVAIFFATWLLLYVAYGFGISSDGKVIQNGLVFVSSQPHPAMISVDGRRVKDTTNTRLQLPSDRYEIMLSRPGYRNWRRSIDLLGGDVRHFDYPLLIPTNLQTTSVTTYTSAVPFTTQSLDRRWLLVQRPTSILSFDLYDLKNPNQAATTVALPSNLLTTGKQQSWQLISWADDNRHVLLAHVYDGKTEYILVDWTTPNQSVNLTRTLNVTPRALTLDNQKYNQYILYTSSHSLQTISLQSSTPTTFLNQVLAYQTYGKNGVLYVTSKGAATGYVWLKLLLNGQTYTLHSLPANSHYLLNLAGYNGTLYVAAGATSENKVYVYKDPVGQLHNLPDHAVTPIQVLHVDHPSYVSFSTNAQFVMVEGGPRFCVYDIENQLGYSYKRQQMLDKPQTHAAWMDGDRLTYVSHGLLTMFDYDNANQQTLMSAAANELPIFTPDYHTVWVVAPRAKAGTQQLTQTSLLIPADQ
ncbi:MAG TPA: PEGA domain-containing protein [Candidatus Saccharimonadales bacterium]|nr:PEGA domain-containing protein [Candidatus Saccharimonadales bacterium]